jgi:hypothetical protein
LAARLKYKGYCYEYERLASHITGAGGESTGPSLMVLSSDSDGTGTRVPLVSSSSSDCPVGGVLTPRVVVPVGGDSVLGTVATRRVAPISSYANVSNRRSSLLSGADVACPVVAPLDFVLTPAAPKRGARTLSDGKVSKGRSSHLSCGTRGVYPGTGLF